METRRLVDNGAELHGSAPSFSSFFVENFSIPFCTYKDDHMRGIFINKKLWFDLETYAI